MKIVESFENYLDCEIQCNNKSDPTLYHLLNKKDEIITFDQNDTQFDPFYTPKIVYYAENILERGCNWNKDSSRWHKINLGHARGIPYILRKTIVKIDMRFKKQRNHFLCGFGKENKKFVLSDEVRPTVLGFLILNFL